MPEYDPDKKVYLAQDVYHSIHDLLRSFTDPALEVDGMSRISDLHLKAGEPLCYRYDGHLEVIEGGATLTDELIRDLIFPLLRESQRESLMNDRMVDVDSGYCWAERGVNFRLNLFYERDGLACVMRMLPKSIPEADTLGFLNDNVWEDLVQLKQGLVLVTGVTGSGKSTTIASLIDYINRSRKVRIITLEDPVEYIFKSEQALISQRELGSHLKTFSGGLKSALRENPDIIYVGEMRDAETAALALSAAETGHLVFSTLHTRDAKGAFSRVIDMFPGERSNEIAAQLSFSMAYVICQKLIKRKSGSGRVPAFEVLKNDSALGNIIRTGKLHQVYGKIETGVKFGMNTLEQHLLELLENDVITRDEAIVQANDPNFTGRV